MVFAFLIQTLPPCPMRVLYSQVFGFCEENQNLELDPEGKGIREHRKEALSRVALRVQGEYSFRRSVNFNKYDDDAERFYDANAIPDFEKGLFCVPAGTEKAFATDKIVMWQGNPPCAIVMIMEKCENRLLADIILKKLSDHLQVQVNLLGQPKQVLLKPDKVQSVVDHLLPNGQLLCMTHRVVRQMEKELEKVNK